MYNIHCVTFFFHPTNWFYKGKGVDLLALVFIAVQNLVAIGVVVLKIDLCDFLCSASLACKFLFTPFYVTWGKTETFATVSL